VAKEKHVESRVVFDDVDKEKHVEATSWTRIKDNPIITRITPYIGQSISTSICFMTGMPNFHLPINISMSLQMR